MAQLPVASVGRGMRTGCGTAWYCLAAKLPGLAWTTMIIISNLTQRVEHAARWQFCPSLTVVAGPRVRQKKRAREMEMERVDSAARGARRLKIKASAKMKIITK